MIESPEKAELPRRVWMGLAIVCMVGLLIGAILSIRGQDEAWVARRLEAAALAVTEEILVEGTLRPLQTPAPPLLTPYTQEAVLGFRAWRDTERAPADAFKDAEQQALIPLKIVSADRSYAIDTRKLKTKTFDAITWMHPRDGELILGKPTSERKRAAPKQQPPASFIYEREIALRENDAVCVLGIPSHDAELGADTLGGENLVIFRGTKAEWIAQSETPDQKNQTVRYAGLGVMAASAFGLLFLLVRLIIGRLKSKAAS